MPVGQRGTNTQEEALKKLLNSITEIKTMPDADLEFLVNLETTILQYIRGRVDQAMAPQPPSPDPQMAGVSEAMSGMGMAAMPAGPGGGGGVPGLRQEPAMPNPDELRRMLNQ